MTQYVQWRMDGPALNSYADEGGFLGCDYTVDMDTRWDNICVLAPKRNVIDLDDFDSGDTLENAHKAVLAEGSSLVLLYILRGTRPAKVNLATMANINSGIQLASVATDVLVTKSAGGTLEVTFAMNGDPMEIITAIGATTDTTSINDETEEIRILGRGAKKGSQQQIIGLGGDPNGQRIASNILAGSVTMDASAWTSLEVLTGDDITFTGFGLDGDFQILGTSKGPYYFNENRLTYYPMFEEMRMDESLEHCRVMFNWFYLGTVITFRDGMRWWSGGNSESFGLERYLLNTSPVRGRPTAVSGDRKWLYVNYYDDENDDSWLTAWRPRTSGDKGTEPMVPYIIGHLDGIASRFLTHVGNANGARTNPAVVGGHDGNAYYWVKGRDPIREYTDANYRFQLSGTWYGTEWRAQPRMKKFIEFIEFEPENVSATQTITVSVSVDGGAAQQIGGVVSEVGQNGYVRLIPKEDIGGWRIKPQVAFATGSDSSSPRIRGPLRIGFRPEQYPVDGVTFP